MSTTSTHRTLTEAIMDVMRPQPAEELSEASTLIQKNSRKIEDMLAVLRSDFDPHRSSYVKALASVDPQYKVILTKAFEKVREIEGLMDDMMELDVKQSVKDQDQSSAKKVA